MSWSCNPGIIVILITSSSIQMCMAAIQTELTLLQHKAQPLTKPPQGWAVKTGDSDKPYVAQLNTRECDMGETVDIGCQNVCLKYWQRQQPWTTRRQHLCLVIDMKAVRLPDLIWGKQYELWIPSPNFTYLPKLRLQIQKKITQDTRSFSAETWVLEILGMWAGRLGINC